MTDQEFEYYKFVREIPERGEAVTIYQCDPKDGALSVRRFVTHLTGVDQYDCLDVNWTMELVRDEVEPVEAADFNALWEAGCG